MSVATAALSRDPRTRHEGGFDRWNFASRAGWSIIWRGSEHASYALGEGHAVWIWDTAARMWTRLPSDDAHTVYHEHELTMRRLRRAVLVVKLLASEVSGEREAARSALQRIATAVVADWQIGRTDNRGGKSAAWFDHPAAVYLAVTQDCRFHLHERERMAFDPAMFAELVASARDDFKAGLRAEPPRLRPNDLVHLQTHMTPTEHHDDQDALTDEPQAAQADVPGVDDPHRHPENDRIHDLRQAVAEAVQAELKDEEGRRQRRRRFWLISGSVAASLVAILAVASVY